MTITKKEQEIINNSIHTYKAGAIKNHIPFVNYPEYEFGDEITPIIEKLVECIRRVEKDIKSQEGFNLQAVVIPELAPVAKPNAKREVYLFSDGKKVVVMYGLRKVK